MNKVFRILLVLISSLSLLACIAEDEKAVLNNTGLPTLQSDKTTVVLDELIASSVAVNFQWTNPTFNPSVGYANYLEFSANETSFSPSQLVILPADDTQYGITHLDFNNALAALNIEPNIAKDIYVRVKSVLNAENAVYSNIVKITVTPYMPNPDLIYPKINVPGGYAEAAGYANWSPVNTFNLFSPGSDDKYRGFIYVTNPNSEFKFTENQDWAGDKGDDGTFTGKLVADNEENCKAAVAGTYYLKVDWTANTYSSVIANFGIIGDATPNGWGPDVDFTFNTVTKKFEIPSIALSNSGVFKFRANDDGGMKIQPKETDETLLNGKAVQTYFTPEGTVTGDPNYKVAESGNYKVELDLHNSGYYSVKVTKL